MLLLAEPLVGDLIIYPDSVLAQAGPDFALQKQIGAKYHGLPHLALRPHRILIALPCAVHIEILGRDVGNSAVQAQATVCLYPTSGILVRCANPGHTTSH